MSSGLEIRICTLEKIVTGGAGHSLGRIQSQANINAVANTIVALSFDGSFITSDLSDLRDTLQLAIGAGFPGTDVLVIAAAEGLSGVDLEVAGERALAVKDFLLANGVPARNVAADIPSLYRHPTKPLALPPATPVPQP